MIRVGTGRLRAVDERDNLHKMAGAIPLDAPQGLFEKPAIVWPFFEVHLDQGDTPQCVSHAWSHFCLAYPTHTTEKQLFEHGLGVVDFYNKCQDVDEWPGNNYDGTSVRAGAKVLQKAGRIGEYVWADNANELRDFVVTKGPAVAGTDWELNMFWPDAQGFIHPGGPIVGGHAYLIIGYSFKRRAFRMLNSWGLTWGQRGRAWISHEDMDELLVFGEACSTVEHRVYG